MTSTDASAPDLRISHVHGGQQHLDVDHYGPCGDAIGPGEVHEDDVEGDHLHGDGQRSDHLAAPVGKRLDDRTAFPPRADEIEVPSAVEHEVDQPHGRLESIAYPGSVCCPGDPHAEDAHQHIVEDYVDQAAGYCREQPEMGLPAEDEHDGEDHAPHGDRHQQEQGNEIILAEIVQRAAGPESVDDRLPEHQSRHAERRADGNAEHHEQAEVLPGLLLPALSEAFPYERAAPYGDHLPHGHGEDKDGGIDVDRGESIGADQVRRERRIHQAVDVLEYEDQDRRDCEEQQRARRYPDID